MHSLGRLRAVRAQGGAARSLSRRASRGFIRHFPSRAARASTSSPGCGASLPPPADPPRAPPRAVLAERSTRGAASPVCRLLREAGRPLPGRLSFLLLPILGFSSPELSTLPGPRRGGIGKSLESGVPGRCRTGQRRGTIQRGNWDSGPGAGPRAALDLPGLCVAWTGTQPGPPRVPSVTGVSAPSPPAHSGRALAWRRPGSRRDRSPESETV